MIRDAETRSWWLLVELARDINAVGVWKIEGPYVLARYDKTTGVKLEPRPIFYSYRDIVDMGCPELFVVDAWDIYDDCVAAGWKPGAEFKPEPQPTLAEEIDRAMKARSQ